MGFSWHVKTHCEKGAGVVALWQCICDPGFCRNNLNKCVPADTLYTWDQFFNTSAQLSDTSAASRNTSAQANLTSVPALRSNNATFADTGGLELAPRVLPAVLLVAVIIALIISRQLRSKAVPL